MSNSSSSGLSIPNNRSLPLAAQTYFILLGRILSFELQPYRKLSESLVAKELGVSRTPVREAMARLAELNLVDILPQRGTYVAPLRLADLRKSQFMREAIEIALLGRVMALDDRSELVGALRNEVALQVTFVKVGDVERFYASDEDFHELLARHAQLPSITREVEVSAFHMNRFRRLMIAGVDDLDEIISQHDAIVDAIEMGDAAAAQDLMLSHLRRVFVHLNRATERFPQHFDQRETSQKLKVNR